MSKRSRRYLILILVFVLFFDSILVGMYLMIDAKGDKTENQNRMGMGKVEQKVESVKAAKQKKCMPHLGLCGLIVKGKIRVTQLLFPVLTAVMQNKASFYKRKFKKMSGWE